MDTDFIVRRTELGHQAVINGKLERKALNLLRLAQDDVHTSTFRKNLKNYGDIDALIAGLLEQGHIVEVSGSGRVKRTGGWKAMLGFGGKKSSAAAPEGIAANDDTAPLEASGTDVPTLEPTSEIPSPTEQSEPEQDFGGLPLPDVSEGFAQKKGADVVAAKDEASAKPLALGGAAEEPEAARTLEAWHEEEASEVESELINKYTTLLDQGKE